MSFRSSHWFIPVLLSGLLVGCSATNPNILNSYDASSTARVRIFVYSADRIRLDFDRTCYTSPGMMGHGEGLEAIQRGHYQGSRSVGMPPTLKNADAVFDEFIITAGIPVTVFGQVGGTYRSQWVTISSPETKDAGYFVPVAGKDYEIYVQKRKVIVEDLGASSPELGQFVALTQAGPCVTGGKKD